LIKDDTYKKSSERDDEPAGTAEETRQANRRAERAATEARGSGAERPTDNRPSVHNMQSPTV